MEDRITDAATAEAVEYPWGRITWLQSSETGAQKLTVGQVVIDPGQANPVHSHPNCEEALYLISGELDHALGADEMLHMTPGMSILIPKGVKHNARCTSAEPAVMMVAYSSANREIENE